MLLAKRNQDLMPSLFNELMNWDNFTEEGEMPKMNVSESDKNYELELCVPGLSKEDLSINIDSDNNLIVEMAKKEEKKDERKDRHYLRHEFSQLQFKQIFTLPENVKKEAIEATVQHGVLRINLPKLQEEEKKAQMRQIEIK
jgi:HSP20 family protein